MKSSDIINQMLSVLPSLTSLFSEEISISTLSKSGTTTTAVTSTAHGLSTGNYVYIVGAKRQTPISSITRVGTIATAVTSVAHDLTEGWFSDVEIVGSDQADYNGTHDLLTANHRNTFTFTVTGAPATPATGTMYLLEPWRRGFNGWFPITVTNSTTFTYTSPDSYSASAYGTMKVRTLPRISGALNVQRAMDMYTKFGQNKLWAFVSLGPVTASKDRYSISDAIATHTTGSTFRQNLVNRVSVYVFVPMRDTLSGRAERDLMTDVGTYLYKTLLGRTYPSYFVDLPSATLNLVSNSVLAWDTAYYVHEFVFEAVTELTKNDVVEPEYTRAFRDANINFNNVDYGETIMSTDIDLDDDPQ